MGTRARWFRNAGYIAYRVDEDGEDYRAVIGDLITELKDDLLNQDGDRIRIYRRGRYGDRLVGEYIRKNGRIKKEL